MLKEILEQKRMDIKQSKQHAFLRLFRKNKLVLIGEVKIASPSAGILLTRERLIPTAQSYANAKIDAISVITETHFFHGDILDVQKVKVAISLPILQKDFIINTQQIYEAKAAGSDALLLIARIVSRKKLALFVEVCLKLKIDPVVEINNSADLQKALQTKTRIIAVNARDLNTFNVDVEKACRLIKKIPVRYVKLGFSGIRGSKEVAMYKKAYVNGILIGTSLVKEVNVDAFLSSLNTKAQ
ncbi:MAG: indole-3-glycerol-phosphate synthase [Patescibacteria group bacterium]|nr:indole-3-glycerol-phosphate synthase [Patescibacteria group bacterium]